MKYVITDLNEANIGNGFHRMLASNLAGRVVAAGHFVKEADGSVRVFGESIGYGIDARPEDALKLQQILAI